MVVLICKKSLVIAAVLFAFVGNSEAEVQKGQTYEEWLKQNQAKEQPAPKAVEKPVKAPKPSAPKKAAVKAAPNKTVEQPTPKESPAPKIEQPKEEAPTPVKEQPKVETPAPKVEQPKEETPPAPAETETAKPTAPIVEKDAPAGVEEDGDESEEAEGEPGPEEKKEDGKGPGFPGTTGSAEKEAETHGHTEELVAPFGITGGWWGGRKILVDHGLTIKGLYTGEVASNYSGGPLNKNATIYHDNLDLTMNFDTEKAGWWSGGTLWVYGMRDHGPDPSAATIGDTQTASNIGAYDQFIINEAWYNQDFFGGKFSALGGLYNLNSEFLVSTYGSLFINSSFGIEPEVSHNVTVSIFPMSGLGARLRAKPTENTYIQMADFDGNPTMRQYPVSGASGEFRIAEAGITNGPSDYKIGYWRQTAALTYGGKTYENDFGEYGIIDQQLYQFDNAEHSSINVFLEYGWVPAERNNITSYTGGGLHLHGIIPNRPVDDLGFAVAKAYTHVDAETVYELTYRFVLTDRLTFRPDYQWIVNPGGNAANNTANVAFLRFEIQL
ncbi:MAG: carbohydrate porin [Nitrospinae bacterium]|nr:carbohydrate porin [Nitrospinota bacterium]